MLISRSLGPLGVGRDHPRALAVAARLALVLLGPLGLLGCGDSVGGDPAGDGLPRGSSHASSHASLSDRPNRPTPPANVLLISIDTLRADHMSVYGYEHPTTPTLDGLAKQGLRFDAAYAPTATTAPSHASLFTSLYPPTHRVIKNGRSLAAEHETLAEVLTRWGYHTGAVVSSYVLHGKFNYGQGFESWNDDFSAADSPVGVTAWEGGRVEGKFYGRADDTTRRAIEWLKGRSATQPFFLFVHYFDPHDPYLPPAGFAQRFEPTAPRTSRGGMDLVVARYDGEIAYTDQQIGRLLAALDAEGVANETVVVAIGDHGEGLMDHGHLNHGVHLYEEAVRIPLILRWPGHIPADVAISTPVELTDVAPTILELVRAGVEGQDDATQPDELLSDRAGSPRGRSLARLLLDDAHAARRPVYLYRRHYDGAMVGRLWTEGEKFAIRDGRWKYIRGGVPVTEELYDLAADPGEHEDLRASFPQVARQLAEELASWRARVTHGDPATAPPSGLSGEDRARLRALGYAD